MTFGTVVKRYPLIAFCVLAYALSVVGVAAVRHGPDPHTRCLLRTVPRRPGRARYHLAASGACPACCAGWCSGASDSAGGCWPC